MICFQEGKLEEAAFALLHCAWASDDAKDKETAKTCRLKAAELLEKVSEDENSEKRMLIRMDALRRASEFEKVSNLCSRYHFTDQVFSMICEFQRMLADNHDDTVYRIDRLLE